MWILIVLAAVWIVSAAITWASENAYWKHQAETRWTFLPCNSFEILPWYLLGVIAGPLGVLLSGISSDGFRHGFYWKYWETKGR